LFLNQTLNPLALNWRYEYAARNVKKPEHMLKHCWKTYMTKKNLRKLRRC